MKLNWKIISLTGIVLLAVIVFSLQLYESGKKMEKGLVFLRL
jgi:hypothetical protein